MTFISVSCLKETCHHPGLKQQKKKKEKKAQLALVVQGWRNSGAGGRLYSNSMVVLPAISLVLHITSAILGIFCSSLPFRCGGFGAILRVGSYMFHLFSSSDTTTFTLHFFLLRSYILLWAMFCRSLNNALGTESRCCVSPILGEAWLCLRNCAKLCEARRAVRAGRLVTVFFFLCIFFC